MYPTVGFGRVVFAIRPNVACRFDRKRLEKIIVDYRRNIRTILGRSAFRAIGTKSQIRFPVERMRWFFLFFLWKIDNNYYYYYYSRRVFLGEKNIFIN